MARAGDDRRKTVRFTNVVERSGEPRVHTLWLPPDQDPELARARAAHRVMTIERRARGAKSDVGHVGFAPSDDHQGQFLIFPRSLQPFEGAKIVGIKFDLVEQPKVVAATATPSRPRATRKKAKSPARASTRRSAEDTKPTSPERHAPATPPRSEPRSDHRSEPPSPARKLRKLPRAGDESPLLAAVRAALHELEAGKTVGAYQRLSKAVAAHARAPRQ